MKNKWKYWLLPIIAIVAIGATGVTHISTDWSSGNWVIEGNSTGTMMTFDDTNSKIMIDSSATLDVDGASNFGGGTDISAIVYGEITVANGDTTATATVTGLESGDMVIVSPEEAWGSATNFYAAATADTITVTVDQDPGQDVDFFYYTAR